MTRAKGTPPAVRRGAKVDGENYTIRNKFLRRVCQGLDWEFTPRNPGEELAFAGFLDKLNEIVNAHARRMAKRAINSIGRKD